MKLQLSEQNGSYQNEISELHAMIANEKLKLNALNEENEAGQAKIVQLDLTILNYQSEVAELNCQISQDKIKQSGLVSQNETNLSKISELNDAVAKHQRDILTLEQLLHDKV